ncbi:MAG TPA: hypothetical protein PKD85_02600 [Saprospiraceae bacterium]|nr:hypothetical protein [Saprospiraceae bacterium]
MKKSTLNSMIANIRKGSEVPISNLVYLSYEEKDIVLREIDKTFHQLSKEKEAVLSYINEHTLSWSEGSYVYDEIVRKENMLDRIEFFLTCDEHD